MNEQPMRIVLAHSGGLETSVAIPWLAERFGAEVVSVTLDLGQGSELTDVRERALAAGAVRAHVIDARDDFLQQYVIPSLQAGALHDSRCPLSAALGRAIVAKRLVDVAHMEGAPAIAHGAGLEASVRSLDPAVRVIAFSSDWGLSREDQVAYARARNIQVATSSEGEETADANVWGRSVQAERVGPGAGEQDVLYTLTRSPQDCPDEPAYITIDFNGGVPVRANGIDMALLELIESLEIIAGAHGVGRIESVETRTEGGSRRVAFEAPAAVVLHGAHAALERLVTPPELNRLKQELGRTYAGLVHAGGWFSPTREAIDAFVRTIQPRVTGSVRLKLFRGEHHVVECRATQGRVVDRATPPVSDGVEHAAEGLTS